VVEECNVLVDRLQILFRVGESTLIWLHRDVTFHQRRKCAHVESKLAEATGAALRHLELNEQGVGKSIPALSSGTANRRLVWGRPSGLVSYFLLFAGDRVRKMPLMPSAVEF